MKTIIGDILDVVTERGGILVHQVNCQRVAGAGLALQIRQRWPEWYRFYRNGGNLLGYCTIFHASPTVTIASLYAQQKYGRTKVQLDYIAFDQCLRSLQLYVGNTEPPPTVYFPHGIGCGLAGGFWPSVHHIIRRRFPDAPIVQLPEAVIADGNFLLDNTSCR